MHQNPSNNDRASLARLNSSMSKSTNIDNDKLLAQLNDFFVNMYPQISNDNNYFTHIKQAANFINND